MGFVKIGGNLTEKGKSFQQRTVAQGIRGHIPRLAIFTSFLLAILLLNLATALAYVQSHNLSEIRNIDKNLDMGSYQLNASYVNATTFKGAGTLLTNVPWSSITGAPSFITDGNTNWDNIYGLITDGNTGWDNAYGFITSESDPQVSTVTTSTNMCYATGSAVTCGDNTFVYTGSILGIGISSPFNGKLHVDGGIGMAIYGKSTASYAGYFDGPVYSSTDLEAGGGLYFNGELMPDGATCSAGQILKKTGANDWDCATDAGMGGSGTTNRIPKFTAGTTLGDSAMYESGGNIGIGTTSPASKLSVNTNGAASVTLYSSGGTYALYGDGATYGLYAFGSSFGTYGQSTSGTGVYGTTSTGKGVEAVGGAYGVYASGTTGVYGMYDFNNYGTIGTNGVGVSGTSSGNAISGSITSGSNGNAGYFTCSGGGSSCYGIWATGPGGATDRAGSFSGNVYISGSLTKGSGSFLIDHPLDPKNEVLRHSFVESPEMANIYKGNNRTAGGIRNILMPAWFVPLNGNKISDYSFVITPLNGFCGGYYVDNSRIAVDGSFIVRTEKDCEFSWVVYAVRHDAYALKHPLVVEENKTEAGFATDCYLSPESFGAEKDGPEDCSKKTAEEK